MPSPAKRIWLLLATTAVLLMMLYLGYNIGRAEGPSDENLAVIEEAWNVIHEDYVDPSAIDSEALAHAAVQAMMDTLDDPHSLYMDAEMYQVIMKEWEGKYVGIGAGVSKIDGKITISSVTPDSPAEKSGMKTGDVILEIDGVSTADMTLTESVSLVRGEEGTRVKLLVQHEGESGTELLEITRAEIKVNSVYFEMIDDIAYISISQFTDTTNDELTPVLQELSQNGARGIILDLRDNPGGLETSVVDVASRFIAEGDTILTIKYSDGSRAVDSANHQSLTTDLPVVVLVNENSASASEVLSGALQDYGIAVIAGKVTYGKGSVNQTAALSDGSAIYISIARWYTPNGHMIEGQGITPDYTLDDSVDWVQWAVDYLHGSEKTGN
jgi:carboxyl-terminal processing protease